MIILLDPPVTDIIVVYRFYDSLDDRVQGSPKSALGPYHVSVDSTEERNQCSTMSRPCPSPAPSSTDQDGYSEYMGI